MSRHATDRFRTCSVEDRSMNFDTEMQARVGCALAKSAYYSVRRIQCSMQGGLLTLCGRVPTYHLKQIAQTLAIEVLNQSTRINNQLEVDGASIAAAYLPVGNSIDQTH